MGAVADSAVGVGRHLIADFEGAAPGPLLVVVASLHGNEPAGVAAARRVAMLSGDVPDAVTTRDVVTDLSAPSEDDAEGLAWSTPTPAVRMH